MLYTQPLFIFSQLRKTAQGFLTVFSFIVRASNKHTRVRKHIVMVVGIEQQPQTGDSDPNPYTIDALTRVVIINVQIIVKKTTKSISRLYFLFYLNFTKDNSAASRYARIGNVFSGKISCEPLSGLFLAYKDPLLIPVTVFSFAASM